VVVNVSVFVSQALDQDMRLLHEPLSLPAPNPAVNTALVVLGGLTDGTRKVVDDLLKAVEPHHKQVIRASSWDELDVERVPYGSSLLTLTDCDGQEFWSNLEPEVFAKFTTLVQSCQNVIWTTWGADRENPDGAMTIGFFRSLAYDLPASQLQVIDLEKPDHVDSKFLAESVLRLGITATWKQQGVMETKLWSTEPEIRIRDGQVMIPRVVPQKQRNDRYNSIQRDIYKQIDIKHSVVEVVSRVNHPLSLREDENGIGTRTPNCRRVRVVTSTMLSLATLVGRFYFSIGVDMDTNESVLCASVANASIITVPVDWSVPLGDGIQTDDEQYMSCLVGYLISQRIVSLVSKGGCLVVHGLNPALESIISRKLSAQRSRYLFTTSKKKPTSARNWAYLHPYATDRALAATLPRDPDVFLDLTPSSTTTATLGSRIAAMMPIICLKYRGSILLSKESHVPYQDDEAIQHMLQTAHRFALEQLYSMPLGMPLNKITLSAVMDASASTLESLPLIDWRKNDTVSVKVQPIYKRPGLFKPGRTYWLVGLAGDLGRSLCDFMIEHGARCIVLTSRNAKAEEEWVRAHKNDRGAEIIYLRGDIADLDDVKRMHAHITEKLPPIAGVANGALVLRDRGIINMDIESFYQVTKPKVEGTANLNEVFSENTLDWFIALSSVVAMLGNHGQMAYAAANMFMKAIISQRRHRGLAGSVIDISQVIGVGYVEREIQDGQITHEIMKRTERQGGILRMCETDLHQLFAEAVIAGQPGTNTDPELLVAPKIISAAEKKNIMWGNNARFGHFVQVGSQFFSIFGPC
jgi:NAD(P)-dependent dehydrogenase (short-subunit alcohol dehydrogenase family)